MAEENKENDGGINIVNIKTNNATGGFGTISLMKVEEVKDEELDQDVDSLKVDSGLDEGEKKLNELNIEE